jgi:hypothetical protein
VLCYDRFFENPAREIATLLNFCGLKPAGGAALATAIRADLRHHQNDLAALLACDEITRDVKLLYVALRALESDDKLAWQESRFDEAISSLMRLIDDSAQDQIVAQLQSRLNRSEAELADLRAEIWRDTKANHRWAYRFYRKVLRPFQLARFRSSSR